MSKGTPDDTKFEPPGASAVSPLEADNDTESQTSDSSDDD